MGAQLTIRDELRAMRDRLRALDREHGEHTGWLLIASNEVADALRELPRAVLALPSELLKAGLEPARGAAPAASEGAPAAGELEASGTPAVPAILKEVGHVKTPRVGAHEPPVAMRGGPAAIAPAADSTPPKPCPKCGDFSHNGRYHNGGKPREARAATVAMLEASDAEDPEPGPTQAAELLPAAENITGASDYNLGGRPRQWGRRHHVYGPATDETGPFGHLVHVCEGCSVARTRESGMQNLYRLPDSTEWVRGIAWCTPAAETSGKDARTESINAPQLNLTSMPPQGAHPERVGGWSLPILPTADRVGPQRAPSSVHAVRHLMDAPGGGVPGLARCGAAGDVRVVMKRTMVTCADCLRLSAPPCTRCGKVGHTRAGCPLVGDKGVQTIREYRAAEKARLEAVRDQPIEVVLVSAPAILPLSTASPMVEKEEGCGAPSPDPAPSVKQNGVCEAEPVLSSMDGQFDDPGRLHGETSSPADATPALRRARAKLAVRTEARDPRYRRPAAITIAGRLSRDELRAAADDIDPSAYARPASRHECQGGAHAARPCPFVACSHHLFLDVNPDTGSIKLNFPHLEVWEMTETCSLDVADRGGITLEQVGAILNLTRERIRQVEVRGLEKIKDTVGDELVDAELPDGRSNMARAIDGG